MPFNRGFIYSVIGFLLCVILSTETAQATDKVKREKVIDFEDELVEGMNKRPLDSLSQIGDAARRRKKPHLYRKRIGFRAETLETARLSRYVQ